MTTYTGPATIFLNADELLVIWSYLERIPTQETEEIRKKIKQFLERQPQKEAAE